MLLTFKRTFLILFLSIFSAVLGAQTLYWVGGSGNFNDPKHWSSFSEGISDNSMLPDSNTTLVFNSDAPININLNKIHKVKSLVFLRGAKYVFSKSEEKVELIIEKELLANTRSTEISFSFPLKFIAAAGDLIQGKISVANLSATEGVSILSGSYKIENTCLVFSKQLSFLKSKLEVENSLFFANQLLIDNGVTLSATNSRWNVSGESKIGKIDLLKAEKSYINDKGLNSLNVSLPNTVAGKAIGSGTNQISATCNPTILVTKPTCSPGCDGKIVVTIPSFTDACYAPNTPTSVYVTVASGSCNVVAGLSNVGPGTYTLSNVCNCGNDYVLLFFDHTFPAGSSFLQSVNVPVTQPVINSFVASSQSISCNGVCSGSVSLVWIGAIAPYSYTISPPSQSAITFTSASPAISQSSLCAGTFSAVTRDASQCTGTFISVFTQPPPILGSTLVNSVTCNGACNGSLTITPSGGSPNYTVNFSNSVSVTTTPSVSVNSGTLCAGPISATITDVKGCTLSIASVSIAQPPALSVTATSSNVSCNAGTNGTAGVVVTGGTPAYNYTWTPGGQTTSSITGLSAGTRTVTIRDANLCTRTSTFNITQPNAITLTPTSTNVVCNGANTGAINITASGGTGAFTFTWVAPGPTTISTGAASSINTLSAGSYTIRARDVNLCTSSVVVTLTQPPTMTLALTTQSISCFGANNGSASVIASGGNSFPYTYTWSAGTGTSSNTNTLSTSIGQGTHSLTVRDASSCARTVTFFIAEPATFTANVITSSLTCNAGNALCNGSVLATPLGGVSPFTYTLVSSTTTLTTGPSAAAASFTGICSNGYTLNARDASNCPIVATFSIGQPPLLSTQAAVPTMSCSNSTVTAVASATGGTGPYGFIWTSPPSTTLGGVNLPISAAGNYTIRVTDTKSCTAQAVVSVTAPSSLSITISTNSISCFNGSNGALSSTVQGGTPAYGYVWSNSGGPISILPNISSLSPGNYTLLITDAQSCTASATGTVQSPTQITTTVNVTPVICNGNSNGTATVLANGGTPGTPSYTFSVNFPTPVTNTSGLFTNQPAGVYTASVLDAAGCTQTAVVNIGTPPPLTATITGLVGSCSANNGAATVTAAGGNGAFTYSWIPAGGTSSVASGLAPGNYSVTVTDASLCAVTRTTNIPFIVNIAVSPAGVGGILCNGASTGSAVVTHTGGLAPFTYSWSPTGPPALTTSIVATLSANIVYTVRVTDSNGCFNEATLTFTNPPAIVINTAVTHVTCFGGNNGAITTTVTGGVTPYAYTWIPGGSNSSSLSLLTAGNYTLNLQDANSCTATAIVNVTQSPMINITFTVTNPTGCVSNNGSICATASGGSGAGYTYSLTPPGASNLGGCFTNLGGGAYSMLVTDGLGCNTTSITSLVNPTSPTLTILSSSVACNGVNTGSLTTTAVGSSPFTFSISPAPGSSVSASPGYTATGLSTGIYFITAIDANSCVTTNSVNILSAPALTLNGTSFDLACNTIPTGSITVAPAGGTPGTPSYTFAWLPGAAITGTNGQGTATVTNLPAGNYTLNLTDGNACITQHTFTLTQPPAITLTAITNSLLCNAVCNGSVVVNAGGGTGALSYSWTAPGNPTLAGSSSPTVTGLCANTGTFVNYSLTITDNNGCTNVTTYTIDQPSALSHTVSLLNPSCSNSCNAVATQTVSGGTSGYTFSWSSSAVTTSSLGSLCAGNYTATATDAHGCAISTPYTVTPPPAFTGTLTPISPLCNNGSNGSITSTLSGAQGTVNYVWSPAGSGANPINLSASPVSIYTLVATDQTGCELTLTTTLTNPPPVLASVSATNPVCHNTTDGAASVSFTNATSPTSYTWQSSVGTITQTSQSIASLSPASYTVIVTDVNTCTALATFTLINPPSYTVTTLVANSTCSLATGAITVNASGATPGAPAPYTYTWIAGTTGSGSVVTNVASGVYSVQVTDAAGCSTLVGVAVSDNGGPNGSTILTTSINCSGNCNGSATLTNISGGLAPYTLIWQSPASGTNTSVSGLCAGDYSVEITDANNCKFYPGTTITEPSSITVVSTSLAPMCNGICDGSIAVTPTGGIAPYTYTWTSSLGGGLPNVSSQTSLCAGTYTLLLGSNVVCVDTIVYVFPNLNSLSITPTITNNACFGDANGVVSVTVGGGSSPYNLSWSNSQTGLIANNLSNGNYTVVVTDAFGCQDSLVSSISSAPQLSLSTAVSQPSCGFSNGSAVVTPTGGTAPYTFTWSTSANTPSISGLASGIYVVTVNDNSLCSTSQTVIVNNSNGITGETLVVQQIPCFGSCSGAATISPIGGNPPINITWLSPATSGSVISNLCPGTYFVQMTDAQNCIRTASIDIAPVITITISPFITPPSCGINNGSISVSVSGGVAPYTFSWSPIGGTNAATSSLGAGQYTILVTESSTNNCSTSQVINLSNPGGPTISSTVTPNPCFNYSLASIQTVGTGTGTIGYSWSNTSTLSSLSNIPSSTLTILTLTVSSTNGTVVCNTLQTFTLLDPPALIMNRELIHHPTCLGPVPCDGSISVQALGGTSPYTYAWSTSDTGNSLDSLCQGIYSLTVTDANSCTLIPAPVYTLTNLSNISVSASSFSSSCSSVNDGSITISFSGGVPNYTVNWKGPGGFSSTNTTLTTLFSGAYTYTVTDSLGCQQSDTLDIAPTLTVLAVAGNDTILCPNTGTITLTGINSSGAQSYKWYQLPNNTNTVSAVVDHTVINVVDPTLYMLVVTASVQACFDSDTVFIDLHPLPMVEAGTSTTIPLEATVQIGGNPTGPTAVSYTWAPAIYLNNASIANPVTSNTFDMVFTVTVQDDNFCISSDTIRVTILPEIYFTNAFSPNGDQKNDTWVIDYIDQFPGSVVEIYNRWGEQLFRTEDYSSAPFDGKFKGQNLPVGTYYYIINLKTPKNGIKPYTGPLTIFR